MIFGNPVIDIKKADPNEELVAVFGYDENREILITDKRIYQNERNVYMASEKIIPLDAVRHTEFRYYIKKQNRISWIGLGALLFGIILIAISIALRSYLSQSFSFVYPVLLSTGSLIVGAGLVFLIKNLLKPAFPKGMPKGAIYIDYGQRTPLKIFIFDNVPNGKINEKIRQAHFKISEAVEKSKQSLKK